MSKVAITGNASGTGVFTVASPNSNVDRVLTLPDEGGTVDTLQRSGNVVQVVNFQTGAVATGTTVLPADNTIPQITEGNEYMTLAITPTNSSNILIVEVAVLWATSVSAYVSTALFQDATAGALAATGNYAATANAFYTTYLTHKMTAGTTSATTFKVRLGPAATSTVTFSGRGGLRYYGGVASSSITITEYTP